MHHQEEGQRQGKCRATRKTTRKAGASYSSAECLRFTLERSTDRYTA